LVCSSRDLIEGLMHHLDKSRHWIEDDLSGISVVWSFICYIQYQHTKSSYYFKARLSDYCISNPGRLANSTREKVWDYIFFWLFIFVFLKQGIAM
jgi:hypothetical protein